MAGDGESGAKRPSLGKGRVWKLSVAERTSDGEAILLLQGRVWQTTISDLDRAARQLVSEGVRHLVLDLSGVDYLNSSALRAIEKLSAELTRLGGHLTLRNPTAPVRVVLELSGSLVHLIERSAP